MSSVLFSEKPEMEGVRKLPSSAVNDFSGDGKCSAAKHNNWRALKITSRYSLLASRSLGAISSAGQKDTDEPRVNNIRLFLSKYW